MKKMTGIVAVVLVLLAVLWAGTPPVAWAGYCTGGTLVVFNPRIPVTLTEGLVSNCGAGIVPSSYTDSASTCRID
jgi:hypothetical protein